MLPNVDHPVWSQIVTGNKKIHTGKAAINLLIQSCKMSVSRDQTPANLDANTAKIRNFFAHYESSFAREIAQIGQ